ncbi:MAG TPA: VOC family protein [Abditibacteriaceae bacterium]|jgi:catechol 2,3-dioxygenase-like lactoylglutathione lyase family enzyme
MIDHVNIVVADIERAARFYGEVLGFVRGFEKVLEGVWIEKVTGVNNAKALCVFMEAPQQENQSKTRLELLQFLAPEGAGVQQDCLPNTRGIRHIAFIVDDLERLIEKLHAWDVEIVSEPIEVPFAVGVLGRKRLFYFYDPEGNLLEAAAYG